MEPGERTIAIPSNALVLLVGAAGSGKSSFAHRCFPHDTIVSSDRLRAAAAPAGKKRRLDVFNALLAAVEQRLSLGALTVVDATNTDWMRRSELIRMARQRGAPPVAIVFNLPLQDCLAQNRARANGAVPAGVVRDQVAALGRDLERLDLEGFRSISIFASTSEAQTAGVEIEKARFPGPS